MDQSKETNFVYYLLSNASMNVYPDNKPQQFRTLLPTPLKLEGEWEVGLSTIIYPHNWNQLKSDSYIKIMLPRQRVLEPYATLSNYYKVEFKHRQFADLDDLVKVINDSFNESLNIKIKDEVTKTKSVLQGPHTYPYLEFALTTTHPRKFYLKNYGYNNHNQLKIQLPNKNENERELWRFLGIEDSVTELTEETVGKHEASITAHFPSLYVYTPMIDYVGVGDTHAPLFAVVPIRGKIGEIVYERFEKPIYVKLNHNYIAEMEISIKDDTGVDVQFGAGKTILILHFRRRS